MRKAVAYIACSLDGKIADKEGKVDWLDRVPHPENSDYGYKSFYESIDTTLMGATTYRDVLGFDVPFPYPDKTNYVITHDRNLKTLDSVTLVHDLSPEWMKDLKSQPGKDIWVVGGSFLNTWMIEHHFLDKLILFIMPVVLGEGIPLFTAGTGEVPGKLKEHKTYSSGVVELHYEF
ncbi:dihydrofolate reductase [bacterium SCSIO 12741]|nr:dihydrofolate reductase [bacterium SCSIO 12741]